MFSKRVFFKKFFLNKFTKYKYKGARETVKAEALLINWKYYINDNFFYVNDF